ncbi:MAG: tyrosine-type recombinase/integrase [Ruminiclostridium sp.]
MSKKSYSKRPDGRLQAKISIGTENGKPKFKYIYASSAKELERKVTEQKIKLCKGIDLSAERDTFKEWGERWLRAKRLSVSNGMYMAYKSHFDKMESLYYMTISKIRTTDVQEVIFSHSELSKKTLKGLKQSIEQILQLAIDNRVMDFNCAKAAALPKNAASPKTRRALTDEEQHWITDTPHRAQTAAMIMMYAGLRRGELIPLTWQDINLSEGTITINKAVEFINGKPSVKPCGKSDAAMRTVFIPQKLVEYLETVPHTSMFVCCSAKGTMLTDIGWKRMWNSYLADLNIKYGDFSGCVELGGKTPGSKFIPSKIPFVIPRITAHWLRHTFITLMYFSGVDVLTAKEQAGHADIRTTTEIYTHLDSVYKKKSMSKMDEYLRERNA